MSESQARRNLDESRSAPGSVVWTVGHSNRSLEAFLALLQENQMELICDVRRFPGSRRYPYFSGEPLAAALAAEKIAYLHLPNLGGRRTADPNSPNTAWRHKAFRGYADYMPTPAFAEGIAALTREAAQKRAAIMCAEALWWQCHRALIADSLKVAGWEVRHILGPGKTQVHPFTSAARMIEGKLSYAAPQESLLFSSLGALQASDDFFDRFEVLGQPVKRFINLLLGFLLAEGRDRRMNFH